MKKIRTRFAPSPTGNLHIGGARTALFNWLFAKHFGGDFVLRIEDTDKERNSQEAESMLLKDLKWLGISWETDSEKEGRYHKQSQREKIYATWFEKLQATNRVYEEEGAFKFKFERRMIEIDDLICGKISIDYRIQENTPDIVIRRSDGSYVFHFVNVIDDIEMRISHVIRGEDHLHNTAKHLQLFEALGEDSPEYAHIPLIQNADGSKMSKRNRGAEISHYREKGYCPEALVNFMALLGWRSRKDKSKEFFTIDELVSHFSLQEIQRSPARFDEEKCAWLNSQHLKHLSDLDFLKKARSFLSQDFLKNPLLDIALLSTRKRVRIFSEIEGEIGFLFRDLNAEEKSSIQEISDGSPLKYLNETLQSLDDWDGKEIQKEIQKLAKEKGRKLGEFMPPCRLALSGKKGGIDLSIIFQILGKDKTLERIQEAISKE